MKVLIVHDPMHADEYATASWSALSAVDVAIGIGVMDMDGHFIESNPVLQQMLGYTRKELQRTEIAALTHPDDVETDLDLAVELLAGERDSYQVEKRYRCKDGRMFWGRATVSRTSNTSDGPAFAVVVLEDITARKQMEVTLQDANALAAALARDNARLREQAEAAQRLKTDFLSTLSHELRTPLAVLMGYLDLLREGDLGPLTAEQTAILQRVHKNSLQLYILISDLLDMRRLETGRTPPETQEAPVAELLRELTAETHELAHLKPQVCVVWRIPSTLSTLHTDRDKLKVVLRVLLSNAIKFTEQGLVTLEAISQPDGVVFRVTDTGIGMTPEVQAVVDELFRRGGNSPTRQDNGIGLGLYAVQRFVELLGGTVTVESQPGEGSTIRVWLPLRRKGVS
jgi:PAS domain S-box-containing protein